MNKKNAEPLDTETTIDMDLVSQKSVEHWLKKFKIWDGTTKKTLLDKVLLLESFFARVFDPVHFTAFPELAEAAITCEDGGEEEPGCGAEFYEVMPCCPFCTHSENPAEELKSEDEIAEYLIRIEATKVRGPGKAPPAAIAPKVEEKPRAVPLAKVIPIAPPKPREEPALQLDESIVEEVAPQTNAPVATVEELDAAVDRAVTTYATAATNAYECAVELKEIHERQLWRQRRDEKGQPKYAHFNNFVEAELAPRGIGRVRAYGLIEMAKKFSRDEFAKLGPAKMNVLVSMDDVPRKELTQETIEKDLSLSEVRDRKEESKSKTPDRSDAPPARNDRAKPGPKPGLSKRASAQPTPESDQAFTMVFPSSTFAVDCIASKGAQKKPKAAKRIEDLPVGEVKGVNGMRLRIAISQAKDGTVQVHGFLVREG